MRRRTVDALHGAAGEPQALVDHEGVARGAELEEFLHVLGDRHFDGGPAGVGRRVDGLRWGFAERAVVDGSGRGGESLGGDDLGGGSERELAPRHTSGELDRLAPAGAQPSRAAEREAEAVALVGVGGRARDERLERANRPVARERQPLALAVGRGRRGEETRLRPRQVARSEGGGNGREAFEPLGNAREVLHLACGETEPLARPVAEAREAEPVVVAVREEGPREPAEDAAADRLLAREAAEVAVELARVEVAVDVAPVDRVGEDLCRDDVHNMMMMGAKIRRRSTPASTPLGNASAACIRR